MPNPSLELFQGSDSEWDDALAGLEGRTFCHQAGWGPIFERVFGHEAIRIAARDEGGALVGLLPVIRMRSRIFGHNLISMPFLNYGGPLGPPEVRLALATRAAEIASESGAKLLELRSRSETDLGLPVSTDKITVLLELPDDPEILWTKGIKAKVRSQIRRPQKAGMTAATGPEHLAAFYSVFSQNMRDLGTPVLPKRLFEEIVRVMGDQVMVTAVHLGDEPVAAGLGFLYDGEFELTWASSLRAHAREAPNMLLYWTLMEDVIRRGARTFNFGRCSPGGGTHRFKKQWGSDDAQLYWSRWSGSGAAAPPSRESPVMQTATRVWQRLPLPVANALGPVVSRALPTW